jgi:ABC-type transport system involved in multi-copper enzyme maturation permease subunit
MLKHLILKEIREIVTNKRSLFVLLICVILIPLGLYVSVKDYEKANIAYLEAKQIYEMKNKDNKSMSFIAEGYIPPSPLSIYSTGLSGYLPDKITTNSKGVWNADIDYGINNPVGLLFGKMDFCFIVSMILSLIALMFTFNSITSEKENGTLRLIISNSITRWRIVLSKILGNYLTFLVTFCVGIISGLLLLTLTSKLPVLSTEFLFPFLIIILFSLLFLFILFNIGILISIKTRNTGSSVTATLLVWVLLAIILPKVSPMIAQVIYPIESEEIVSRQKNLKREEIKGEFDKESTDLMNSIFKERGLNVENVSLFGKTDVEVDKALASYDEQIGSLKDKYSEIENAAIRIIDRDFQSRKNIQQKISKNISRLSPVSCFTYLTSDLTNTGLNEIENIDYNAKNFSSETELNYYSKFRKYYKEYHIGYNYYSGTYGKIDWKDFHVPTLTKYTYPDIKTSIVINWPDLLLICFYALLFFALSVFTFIRYDVR